MLSHALARGFGATGFVLDTPQGSFAFYRHQLAQGTPAAFDGARCSSI